MDEFIFPLAAMALTFGVWIPVATWVARRALYARRRRAASWASFGSDATFAWLIAPTVLPVVWLVSSVGHQNESVRRGAACVIAHADTHRCLDAAILIGMLAMSTLATLVWRLWRDRGPDIGQLLPPEDHRVRRVRGLAARAGLLSSRVRMAVVHGGAGPIYTTGMVRRTIVVDACFVQSVDDKVLYAALLHERAHILGFDTLRGFCARLCLSINPAGFWLRPDLERWRHAREADCDSAAVRAGGGALALAEGIVRAARFRCHLEASAWGLCGHGAAVLRLRISLLMGEMRPPVRTMGYAALGLGMAVAAIAPHVPGLRFLEHFHMAVESAFSILL